jgi:hypothetical protein
MADTSSMSPKQISDIVTAAALATLRQLHGVDSTELEFAARAIGNNAAQAMMSEDDES